MIDGVHIWRAALDEAGWPGPAGLAEDERERAAAIVDERSRRRWVAARWALRRALARYRDEAAAEIELDLDERGKPRLQGGEGLEFNLSHSNGLALVAVAEGREVGLDVELIDAGRDLIALAERALEPDDAAAVRAASGSERPAVFYAAWTRHEARLKCLGTGLADANSRSSTSAGSARSRAGDSVAVENLPWFLCPAIHDKETTELGYAAAVAVAAPEVGPIECRSLRAG
ncbi:MAG TPA: 4'-phosphopantetheinyl transferase superfamily protein [Solirubrobacterales bacterium]|nr:4'-phosphopantetheinyl transferase superfamily protein [Solirubrobacterales bacterium]